MLTKEECLEALHYLVSGQCSYCWKTHGKETDVECQESKKMLEQLINEHFELVKANESLKTQLVECERTCKERLEFIVELASNLESR